MNAQSKGSGSPLAFEIFSPANWRIVPLDAVIVDFQSGYASGTKDLTDGIRHLRMNNIAVNGRLNLDLIRQVPPNLHSSKYALVPGDILVCTTNSGVLVGKSAMFDLEGEYAFSNHLTRLRPRLETIHPKYLHFCLFSFWVEGRFVSLCKHWVNQSTLPKENLVRIPIPLPPLPEQKRIVAKLDSLLGKIKEARQLIEEARETFANRRAAILAKAFRGELTAKWRAENPDVEPAEKLLERIREEKERSEAAGGKKRKQTLGDDEIEEPYALPEGWKWVRLGDLVAHLDQGWSPKCHEGPSDSLGAWGVIRTTAVQSMHFDQSSNKKLPHDLRPRPELEIMPGDLLTTRAGPRIRAGITCLVESTRPRLMICDKVYRFRTTAACSPRFLALALNSPYAMSLIDNAKTGISESGVNLTQPRFAALPVPLAPALEQQAIERIVQELLGCEEQAVEQIEVLGISDTLEKSILARAFRGELGTGDDGPNQAD